jgi:DNA-binding NarL/FixJ family response regulator
MDEIKVLQVDDLDDRRHEMRSFLDQFRGFHVVGDPVDKGCAVGMVRLHQPDLVILDLCSHDHGTLDVIERLIAQYREMKIILLSLQSDAEYVERALNAGVRGYVVKGTDVDEIDRAIRVVVAGGTYVSPGILAHHPTTVTHEENGVLTARQREVLRLLALGKTTKGIARELRISPKTVETHRAQIMDRLRIPDVPGLVRYAIRIGLVSPYQ